MAIAAGAEELAELLEVAAVAAQRVRRSVSLGAQVMEIEFDLVAHAE